MEVDEILAQLDSAILAQLDKKCLKPGESWEDADSDNSQSSGSSNGNTTQDYPLGVIAEDDETCDRGYYYQPKYTNPYSWRKYGGTTQAMVEQQQILTVPQADTPQVLSFLTYDQVDPRPSGVVHFAFKISRKIVVKTFKYVFNALN